jgi:hypothetical protein
MGKRHSFAQLSLDRYYFIVLKISICNGTPRLKPEKLREKLSHERQYAYNTLDKIG